MAEESISKKQAIINALLRKYPELVVPELTIRYDQVVDEHPFYAGVAASTLSTEQGTTVLISSLGLKQSVRELSLTILHETDHVLHPEEQGAGPVFFLARGCEGPITRRRR
jgi:hypothetical protein